jgi:hypothetical protein
MKYLLVAHPEPNGIIHLPQEWAKTPVDHAAHTNCCDATTETCQRLLEGTSVMPTSLDTYLRFSTTSCLTCTVTLPSAQAFGCTRAVREWLTKNNPQYGLIVGGADQINAVLVGICNDLKNYSLSAGSSVFIEVKGLQRDLTFYKPRR